MKTYYEFKANGTGVDMTNIKIAYVVLHYKNAEVTTKCLKYLTTVMSDSSVTVVVDNYSQNNSLVEVQNLIGHNDKMHYISNFENLGFARGNNIGYEYAREILKANCIIVMNNDIFIEDSDFEKKLCSYEMQNKYSVIAPDIVTLSGKHQNPFRNKKVGTWKLFRGMILQYIYAMSFQIGFMPPSVVKKYSSDGYVDSRKFSENIENIVPHGSCVIFTPIYTEKEKFAFVPVTFFYGEEDLLYDYIIYKNHSTIYTPNLHVIHAEKQSTQAISRSKLAVLRFRSKNKAKSLCVCLKYRLFPKKFKKQTEGH